MNGVKYRQDFLMRGSKAYEMWSELQKSKGEDKPKLQKKLDQHLKALDQTKQTNEK